MGFAYVMIKDLYFEFYVVELGFVNDQVNVIL